MNDELPELFRDVAPRPAPAELRAKTLAAVGRELTRRRKPRWERIVELSVAASLALGISLNVWLVRSDEAWQARVVGVPGLPAGGAGRELAAADGGPAAGHSLGERLLSVWSGEYVADSVTVKRYQQLLHELKCDKRQSSL